MFVDMLGKTRVKLGLHTHTTLSDGRATPEEAARIYLDKGYDAIAITDSWKYRDECEIEGLKIFSGCEYEIGGTDSSDTVHIIGVGMTSDPAIPEDWKNMKKTAFLKGAEVIKKIKLFNGLSIVGHPAWSLNTPEQLAILGDFDVAEVCNSVFEYEEGGSDYSGEILDRLAKEGKVSNLVAADGARYYEGDECRSWIMVEATDTDTQSIIRSVRAGRFYATQGPEVHIEQIAPDKVRVVCSPVDKVLFIGNSVSEPSRVFSEEGIVKAEYTKSPTDRFVRAEVTDKDGNKAWTNYVIFD